MLISILERAGDDPLNALSSTSQALKRLAVFCPYCSFIVAIPMQLHMLFATYGLRKLDIDLEPVCRPGGPKLLTQSCQLVVIGGVRCFLESRTLTT
jgi:hypothetical protein